jgi:hypothetical protein
MSSNKINPLRIFIAVSMILTAGLPVSSHSFQIVMQPLFPSNSGGSAACSI